MDDLRLRGSGRIGSGLLVLPLALAVLVTPLAAAYGALCWFSPFALLTAFALFFLLHLIGEAVAFAARAGRVRHRGLVMVAASGAGLVAIVVQWCVVLALRQSHDLAIASLLDALRSPAELLHELVVAARDGRVALHALPLPAWLRVATWLLEAFAIVYGVRRTTASRIDDLAFCEACERFSRDDRAASRIGPAPGRAARTAMDEGRLHPVDAFVAAPATSDAGGSSEDRGALDLLCCPICATPLACRLRVGPFEKPRSRGARSERATPEIVARWRSPLFAPRPGDDALLRRIERARDADARPA